MTTKIKEERFTIVLGVVTMAGAVFIMAVMTFMVNSMPGIF